MGDYHRTGIGNGVDVPGKTGISGWKVLLIGAVCLLIGGVCGARLGGDGGRAQFYKEFGTQMRSIIDNERAYLAAEQVCLQEFSFDDLTTGCTDEQWSALNALYADVSEERLALMEDLLEAVAP